MYRKIIKGTFLCMSVILFTMTIGYVVYISTLNILNRSTAPNSVQAVMSDAAPADEASAAPAAEPKEYYIAKLNGGDIEISLVYETSNSEPKEKFLYSFDVYRGGIPESDLADLSRGIILRSREELAAFEEDFGS